MPNRLIGATVTVLVDQPAGVLSVVEPPTGVVHAGHRMVAPGEVSAFDGHYDRPRPDKPDRAPRQRTGVEKQFCALGADAEAFLAGAAAAGVTRLPSEMDQILELVAAHGQPAVVAALGRAVRFGRWRADDIRSILATGGHAPTPPRPAGRWC